ncbi:MAG TPA: DUF4230 domain-containing protein [Streptosporangiaceae bacterium]|nr:DUF4230 domain-containing protein [Streptosporangiaceae bacterium]
MSSTRRGRSAQPESTTQPLHAQQGASAGQPLPVRNGARPAARVAGIVVAIGVAVALLVLALSAVRLLPRLRNPFAEATVDRSQPALLKSITALSRYEAASGSFQVIVDIARKSSFIPSFIEGTDTLFVGAGSDIAFVNFGDLKGKAIVVSKNRSGVTITLPPAQLEPAVLNVKRSYVFSENQGLLNRIGNFFSGNPNSQRQVYILAQQKIQAAARHSQLTAEAEKNTTSLLTGLMRSLGFHRVTVIFKSS